MGLFCGVFARLYHVARSLGLCSVRGKFPHTHTPCIALISFVLLAALGKPHVWYPSGGALPENVMGIRKIQSGQSPGV